MFNLFWRKKYKKNLEAYKDYLINDYKYVDYYKNRIKQIISSTPYYNWDNNLKFNQIKDLEIIFLKDNHKAKVLISSESFEHYNYFTEEYMQLADNVRKSYKRSLREALLLIENEYVQEMEIAFKCYLGRIDYFLQNIEKEIT